MPVEYLLSQNKHGTAIKTLPPLEPNQALWLAGALEIGGTTSLFSSVKSKTRRSSSPQIILQDTKPEIGCWLQDNIGGKTKPIGRSSIWKVYSYAAAGLLLDIDPYSASRKKLTKMIPKWWDADQKDRWQMAEELQSIDRFENLSVDDYLKLLSKPAFLAGIVDYRGLIFPYHDNNWVYPHVVITSKNATLIQAIEQTYHGHDRIRVPAGSVVKIQPDHYTMRDSHILTITNQHARDLIATALPHLIVQPYDDWNRRLVEEKAEQQNHQVLAIQQFVEAEMQEYATGKIARLSTAEEIGREFSLQPRTAARRIEALPDEIKRGRRGATRLYPRKSIFIPLTSNLVSANA